MSSEWANLVSLGSIQREQSYFEDGLGVQLSLDWTLPYTVYPYSFFGTWEAKASSEWANLVLDSIQHKQSYFEVGLGACPFQFGLGLLLSLDWK